MVNQLPALSAQSATCALLLQTSQSTVTKVLRLYHKECMSALLALMTIGSTLQLMLAKLNLIILLHSTQFLQFKTVNIMNCHQEQISQILTLLTVKRLMVHTKEQLRVLTVSTAYTQETPNLTPSSHAHLAPIVPVLQDLPPL